MIISVVIPAYNEEAELPECLAAIRAAARRCFHHIEIIIVDNASTDGTRSCAEREGAFVIAEPRKGISFARQTGYEASKGDIVCCIDADTRMPRDWFYLLLRNFEDGAVAVSGPSFFYDLPLRYRAMSHIFNLNAYLIYLINGTMLQGGNFAVRRDALERAGGFDTSIEFYGEDTDVARRVARHGKIRWAWDMAMPSSGRRMRTEGIIRTGITYSMNYASVMLSRGPVTITHRDIR
jgi:glycosyltransferase involved in cell wall biosynthesis